ncbi:MAG: copper-containing nitrite reductase [Methylococcaceae bacterium]
MKILVVLICSLIMGCSHVSKPVDSLVQERSIQVKPIAKVSELPRVIQSLVRPPLLPFHEQIASSGPKIIEVNLEVIEKNLDIGKGVIIQALTFNGSIPGPIIVAHQGDYIELTLNNASTNQLRHTIDLHAATGALGGAGMMKVDPGESKTIRFKATKAGVFVYHCAPGGAQIPFHVASGMNGAIMVLPREGLKDNKGNAVQYDKAYYIGEQDFYIPKNEDGSYKPFNSPMAAMHETLEVMKGLVPTHLVFNGAKGSLTGKNSLTAEVGEKVLFIHSQANRDSRPHLIGGHADLVWPGGSFSSPPVTDYETWFVAGGSAVAALYEFKLPGTYVYVNHNLIEAILYGAAAHVQVTGDWQKDLMEQVEK